MDEIKEFNINEWLDDLREDADNEAVKQLIESFEREKYEGMNDSERLLSLGELATQINAKVARRILSQLVKQMGEGSHKSPQIAGKAYLLLAEVEENLQKFPRAIKYYQQGLALFSADDAPRPLQSFIYYKIGMLYSAIGNKDEAIHSLKKGLEFANAKVESKIPILVSLGKILGSIEKEEEAFSFLSEALELIEQSTLNNNMIHAEALTEVAYYYFDSGKVDQAIPFYEKAITIYDKEKGVANRKLGMIHMQYAYCLEHKEQSNIPQAGMQYENGLRYLEEAGDRELYENALMDVISFFTTTNNKKKKRTYENKFLKIGNK
jgi:tetratricopeptide (TPR) repeat protein